MKIGIYGGTLNPIHLGHMAAAKFAMEYLKLDRLYLVPVGIPPHKELADGTPAPRHRLAMAQLAGQSIGEHVEVLDLEKDTQVLIRGKDGGTNHLVVKDGAIWCDEASCPDKVCVHTGKISLSTQTIACLPNKMIVRIKGN